VNDEFAEMIQFLDFSFERAFDKREKNFMLAYKVNHYLLSLDPCLRHFIRHSPFERRIQ